MGRTHRVNVHWLHETFLHPWLDLVKTGTHYMRADIFTKGFETLDKWVHAMQLINHVDPKCFWGHRPGEEIITFGPEPPKPESATGGVVAVPAVPRPTTKIPIPRSATRNLHRLISIADWPKGGSLNDSSSVVLGTDFDTSGPRLSLLSSCFRDLIRDINALLCVVIPDPSFQRSSLFIDVNTVGLVRDVPFATGTAFSFVHGKHSGPALIQGSPLTPRTLHVHDATHRFALPVFKGFRVVVTAFLHVATAALSSADARGLRDLGFRVHDAVLPSTACDVSSSSSGVACGGVEAGT